MSERSGISSFDNIRNIIFDLGGVIINLDNGLTERSFAALGAKDFSKYFGHGFAARFFADYEVGKLSNRQFIDALKSMLGNDTNDEQIIFAWNAMLLDFRKEKMDLLKTLGKKYRLFLFSNTNALHLEEVRNIFAKQFSGQLLEDYFEKTYYSHILQLRKPDKNSFEWIVKENELNAEETILIDDAMINVEGAREAGLKGYYLEKGKTILDIDWGTVT